MSRMILVDGYNLLHSFEPSRILAGKDLERAREELVWALIEYGARNDCEIEVVFDAHSAEGPTRSESPAGFIRIVYTGAGITADTYIENRAVELKGDRASGAIVVTGDYHQQKVTGGSGMLRISPREFIEEMRDSTEIEDRERNRSPRHRMRLGERLSPDIRQRLEDIRRRKSL